MVMKIFIAIVYSLCLLQVSVAEQVNDDSTNVTNVIVNGQKIEGSQNVKEIRLDQTTTAKVEVLSSTTNSKVEPAKENNNNENQNNENIVNNKIKKNNTSPVKEDKKNDANDVEADNNNSTTDNIFTKLLNTDGKKKIDDAKNKSDLKTMQKNFNNDEIKNGAVLTIKDGDKNININFSPNIIVECEKCKKNMANAKNKPVNNAKTKVVKKKTSNLNKTRKITQVAKKQNQNNGKKQRQNVKKQSITKNNNKNIATNNKVISQATEAQYTQFINSHKTIRGLYEQKMLRMDDTVKHNDNAEYVALQQAKSNDDAQPIEVITKIIMVDDNANITKHLIDELNREGSNIQVVEPNGKNNNFNATSSSFQLAYAGASNPDFIQKYDIIREDKLKYGEVAFIDDYNE